MSRSSLCNVTVPFGMIEAADFGFVFKLSKAFGETVQPEGVELIEGGMSEHVCWPQW